jgi:hypothetical protein
MPAPALQIIISPENIVDGFKLLMNNAFFALLYIFAAVRKPRGANFVLFDESAHDSRILLQT